MNKRDLSSLLSVIVAVALGAVVAAAGGSGSVAVGGMAVFAVAALVAYVINWIVFVPSYRAGTEQFFDLTGSLTYISVIVLAAALSSDLDLRAVLVVLMVLAWAARLGSFLFARIRRDGFDGRFDAIKTDFGRFFMTWTLQGLWVVLTLACALAVVTSTDRAELGPVGVIGAVIWAVGFAIEIVADRQKAAFRADPANKGRYITSGLWAWSRHPNYFGEILLWVGIAVMAVPILSGWRWLMLISPVFVFTLLRFISGVPMLEARADERWGDEADYQAYKAATPVIALRPPSRAGLSQPTRR